MEQTLSKYSKLPSLSCSLPGSDEYNSSLMDKSSLNLVRVVCTSNNGQKVQVLSGKKSLQPQQNGYIHIWWFP